MTTWIDDWYYRISHVIRGDASVYYPVGYQVRIKVMYGSGVNSGETFYCFSHCKSDFGDIRFTKDDGTTFLDYFLEEKVDGNYAYFWVKTTSNLSLGNSQTIYIYWGNTSTSTTSDGSDTFNLFDDFNDLSNWTVVSGSWSAESGNAKCISAGTLKRAFYNVDVAMLMKWKVSIISPNYAGVVEFLRCTLALENGMRGDYWINQSVSPNQRKYIDVWWYSGGWQMVFSEDVSFAANIYYISDSGIFNIPNSGGNQIASVEFNHEGPDTRDRQGIGGWSVADNGGYIALHAGYADGSHPTYIDWVAIRYFANPEPTHFSWGVEETLIIPPITPNNPYQLLINTIGREYIQVHYIKNHPQSDPDTFDIKVNYDVGQLVNYFDSVEVTKNGVTEFYGFVEDKNPQKGIDGLEYIITGRCWKVLAWKKQTERYIETREIGIAAETGFFGKVYPQELIMFLLRTPISTHPSGYIRQKIGWGIPSDNWECSAIRTATGHHAQWVALRETGFSWQLGNYNYVDNQEVNDYTEDMRQWITSDDTVVAVNINRVVDAWSFVHNDFTHVNTEPWLHDDDENNYISLASLAENIGKYDEHYTFSNLAYDHIYVTTASLYVKAKLYDGTGGHATSVTLKFYIWDGSIWWSGSWAFTSTDWELISFNFSCLDTIAKINNAKLKIEFEAVVDGGVDKGGINVTYAYLHIEGTGITWGNTHEPWLGVSDAYYIEGRIDGVSNNSYMSYFDFEDIPTPTGGWRDYTITTVDLKLVGENVIVGGNGRQVMVRAYLWDGSAWVDTGTSFSWTKTETNWTTKTLDVSSILDTIAKIDSARLRLYFIGTGVGTETDISYVRITQAFLTVEITESPYQKIDDWFKIDLGAEYDRVTAILIENRQDLTENRYPRHFDIQTSQDGITYTTQRSFVYYGARDILASWKPVDDVRYIKIVITGDYNVGWEISQIYVWQTEILKYRLLNEP